LVGTQGIDDAGYARGNCTYRDRATAKGFISAGKVVRYGKELQKIKGRR